MRHYASSNNGFIEIADASGDGWINVDCPDMEELKVLTGNLGVPSSFISDIADVDERPRVDREADWTITILRIPAKGHEQDVPYVTVPIGVICHENLIITLCFRTNDVIDYFIDYTRQRGVSIDNRPDFILHLIYSASFWYLKYLQDINRDVAQAEGNMVRTVKNGELIRLMRMQKTLVYFNTSLRGNEMMLEHLQRLYDGQYNVDLLEDVDIELKQAINTVNIYTDILESTMDALGSVISNNVNAVMKRMTATSIILMVPTLIASFYGMNVDIGLADIHGAFMGIIVLSLLLTIIVLLWLKRIKWF
ncbi:MAG: magnesium transporter CorA family protein [Firmicutes bacterium]|nr:magnesium transporter CorA family protein [Bacillota bacterium]MCM1401382.1 magnesium transporter CorA family protein [Bacteroides sp.]MCM1477869.1 magnesium transporter CorA family protein [Bacteroides sp.]